MMCMHFQGEQTQNKLWFTRRKDREAAEMERQCSQMIWHHIPNVHAILDIKLSPKKYCVKEYHILGDCHPCQFIAYPGDKL